MTDRANAELVVKLRAIGAGIKLRVIVDGKWCTLRAQEFTGLTVGNDYFLRVLFPTAKKRHIIIETVGNLVGFGGVIVASGEAVTRPSAPAKRRVVIGGDSYTGGAQDVNRLETYALMLAKLLGADSVWNFGIGGSGWATTPEFQTRVTAMLAAALRRTPDARTHQAVRSIGGGASFPCRSGYPAACGLPNTAHAHEISVTPSPRRCKQQPLPLHPRDGSPTASHFSQPARPAPEATHRARVPAWVVRQLGQERAEVCVAKGAGFTQCPLDCWK